MSAQFLGLPGVVPATHAWLASLLDALGAAAGEATVLEYRHWTDSTEPDPESEASRLDGIVTGCVVAKSLGTWVATAAFARHGFLPRSAVLIGCPLARHGADGFVQLERFVAAVPTLFIQQSDDKVGAFCDLAAVVGGWPNATLAEVPGDDHVYADIDALRAAVAAWRSGHD